MHYHIGLYPSITFETRMVGKDRDGKKYNCYYISWSDNILFSLRVNSNNEKDAKAID